MRISALPTFLNCPSSALECDRDYAPGSDAASLGSAVHELLERHVMLKPEDIGATAKRYGVDCDDLERLYAYGCIAWRELEKHFPDPKTETELTGDGIKGHADVMSITDKTMTILDWKSGFTRKDYSAQVIGYAAAAVDMFGMPKSGAVQVATVWLRYFEYEVINVTQEDIERLYHAIARAGLGIGKDYAPGDVCTYCKRQMQCEARNDYLRSAAQALAHVGNVEISVDLMGSLYHRSRLLKKAIEHYDKALKMMLAQHGSVSDGCGGVIELARVKRDKIVAKEAWPVLIEAGFTEDDLAACTTMSKTAVLDIVGERAGRGEKQKKKMVLLSILKERGAVTETESDRIQLKKGKENG